MKINYQETGKDLQTRIDIHQKYGNRDIDQWMLEILSPSKGIHILDVGCGSGKQCLAFFNYLEGEVEITGGDVSTELLSQAREVSAGLGDNLTFMELDFNKEFPFKDDLFDLVTCCFAIYYAKDILHTVCEMYRVLKPGGRLFATGPMPENKQLFYDIIREATRHPIPPMPGSSRYNSEILGAIQSQFSCVDVHIFENPLAFPETEPFLAYTRASLSEDRKLWRDLFRGRETFERVMQEIAKVASHRLDQDGRLVMTKVVGGFVAYK